MRQPIAYLLKDTVRDTTGMRYAALQLVLGRLGFGVVAFDDRTVSDETAMNMETQLAASCGAQSSYADTALATLRTRAEKGDVIIVTAAWQSIVFKGTLAATGGRINGAPVIEMWIDYLDSFARFRIFGTHFTRAVQAGLEGNGEWNRDWIVANPCILKPREIPPDLPFKVVEPRDPNSLAFLEDMKHGSVVIAPEYGAWAELIEHGRTGFLYRTEKGRESGLRTVEQLIDRKEVVEWVDLRLNAQESVDNIKMFFERIVNPQ